MNRIMQYPFRFGLCGLTALFVLSGCGSSVLPNTQSSMKSSPLLTSVSDYPHFVTLKMTSTQNGWGQTLSGLWHTTNGGRSWRKVWTQPHTQNFSTLGVVSNITAWVLSSPTKPGPSSLWMTQSGGHRWTRMAFPMSSGDSIALDWQSTESWWYLASPTGPAGPLEQWTLYHTTNAGVTWHSVKTSTTMVPNWDGGIPADLTVSGTRLWITGTRYGTPARPFVLYSANAGKTWQSVSIPVPDSWRIPISAGRPQLWGHGVGAMWIFTGERSLQATVAMTVDNGGQWRAYVPVPGRVRLSSFEIRAPSWAVAASTHTLYFSHSLGRSWQAMPTPHGGIQCLDFLNSQKGWVETSSSPDHSQMFSTANGGKTWQPISPH